MPDINSSSSSSSSTPPTNSNTNTNANTPHLPPLPPPLHPLKTELNRALLLSGDFDKLNTFLYDRLRESGWYETVYDMCVRSTRVLPPHTQNTTATTSAAASNDGEEGGGGGEEEDGNSNNNNSNENNTQSEGAAAAARSYKEIYERVEGEAVLCVDGGVREEVCRRIREVLGGYVVEGG